ncbi:MAG: enoyl-CoA hydratase/isomerase family protein [Syntrophomonadaceae bacterium]|nr:enoyl-CoA hydratase/isomerase family protein [Syntrophomonadaceae bacterium]
MSYETIQVNREDGVAVITLNRPPMNPLNSFVFRDLAKAADEFENDPSVKVVIITGSGSKAFAAGADVSEMANLTPVEAYSFCQGSKTAFSKLENLSKPVIAAISGVAFGGGCELALACDFRIAADNAKFAFPETGLGIIPGGGGTQRLPRLIGSAKAKELILMGDIISAETAEKIGLVNKVVPVDMLMEEAMNMARKLTAKPLVAMQMAKEAINNGGNVDISSGLNMEIQNFVIAFASSDGKEGLSAFVEKRKPNYTDK